MLILGSKLIGIPIMGLQTGSRLAITKLPIIDPKNLKIIAYEVDSPLLSERPSFIRIADVRELSNIGMIIDSNDEFIGNDDVIAIKKLCDLNFKLVGLNVIDDTKHKLGRIVDYSVEVGSFTIQKISVRQKILKSIANTELLIHRSQIVEINNEHIVVRSASNKVESQVKEEKASFTNPFRSTAPQVNNKDI